MKHDIPVSDIGPQGEIMAGAIEACVHCGFCLPACPTYLELRDEMDSPRGRIFLMKEVLEGGLPLMDAAPHLDRCLGCQGCVTACPSGVQYGELITSFRGYSEPLRKRPAAQKAARYAIVKTLENPRLFQAGARLGLLAKPFRPVLPKALKTPLNLLPDRVQSIPQLPEITPARGVRRARVALLAGCAQQVLAPNFNLATLRVLARNGVEVIIPPGQGCCGAAALHTGLRDEALTLARRNLAAFPAEVDAILSNAAGCGAGLREYPEVFHGLAEEQQAHEFARRVMDVSVFLAQLGLEPIMPTRARLKVAYHDACHLAHAQGVRREPRDLIRAIPGVTLVDVPEAEICCGSAGTYNLEQPELAARLGERKARNLMSTGADIVVGGNIGCHTQISSQLARLHSPMRVMHTLELLDLAYRGEL